MFEAGAGTWPDDAKITTLVGGLNKYTRQRIDGQLALPTDYDGFVRTLQTLGNQFGSYGQYNGQRQGNGQGNAMDWEQGPARIAAAKAQSLRTAPAVSPDRRQEWRDGGKCVRCGSSKHWVRDCEFKPTRSRSSSASSSRAGKIMVNVARTKTTAKPSFLYGKGPSKNDPDDDYDDYSYNDDY